MAACEPGIFPEAIERQVYELLKAIPTGPAMEHQAQMVSVAVHRQNGDGSASSSEWSGDPDQFLGSVGVLDVGDVAVIVLRAFGGPIEAYPDEEPF